MGFQNLMVKLGTLILNLRALAVCWVWVVMSGLVVFAIESSDSVGSIVQLFSIIELIDYVVKM